MDQQTAYVDSLPDEIKKSLSDYTDTVYEDINSYLRYGDIEDNDEESLEKIKQDIANIDQAFLNAPPLKEKMTLYRGQLRKIHDSKSYTSTTTNIEVALKDEFINLDNGCCLYIITVVPGSKVLPLSTVSLVDEEDEVLLDRDGQFFLTRKDFEPFKVEGRTHGLDTIYLTYMPKNSTLVPPATVKEEREKGPVLVKIVDGKEVRISPPETEESSEESSEDEERPVLVRIVDGKEVRLTPGN